MKKIKTAKLQYNGRLLYPIVPGGTNLTRLTELTHKVEDKMDEIWGNIYESVFFSIKKQKK